MAEGKALIEGALRGYLPSVPAELSSYEATPVGPKEGVLSRPEGEHWGSRPATRESSHPGWDSTQVNVQPTPPPVSLPPGFSPAEYVVDQSDEVCVPLGYRAGSNIRTPRG